MALSIAAAGLGILAGLAFYWKRLPAKEGWDESKWSPFRKAARDQFGYDTAMVAASVDGGRDLGLAMWQGADASVVDGAVNGAGLSAGWIGQMFGKLQNGFVRQYALIMLIGVVGLLGAIGFAVSKGIEAPPGPPIPGIEAPGGGQ
jgi:NADH-quinone oxidoreductase subunit L